MSYPIKPTGQYSLRDYDFAQADSKKIPMDEYLFKNGYKNAEESETESVPDAHSQNWLFDILHRNLKYSIGTAEENKILIEQNKNSILDLDIRKPSKEELQAVKDSISPSILDVLKTIYPVGSIYLTTATTCPLSTLFGTWSLVSNGKALWTGNGSNGNTTITAGLPDITGTFGGTEGTGKDGRNLFSGAFRRQESNVSNGSYSNSDFDGDLFSFYASRSNSIYGKSTTVQPPAYVVNAFRRTK